MLAEITAGGGDAGTLFFFFFFFLVSLMPAEILHRLSVSARRATVSVFQMPNNLN